MGNVCSCLYSCPFMRKRKKEPTAYDVHEETFQMEENIDSMPIEQINHNINSDNILGQINSESQQSEQILNKEEQPKSQTIREEEIKFIEKRNKSLEDVQRPQKIIQQSKQSPQQLESQTRIKHEQTQIKVQPKPQKPQNPNILKPKTIKKQYNPDDYRFLNEQNQFKVKKIDSIKMQQYNIENCKNCQYFIFDITANVYIDDCSDCFIFIAPCESTIFVRNCKNMTIVAATKQFRTFECHNCQFSLYCKSQPVIESSTNLKFSNFQVPTYQQLKSQFDKIRLQIWNNHWSQIHNFTKKQGQIHSILQMHLSKKQQIDWEKAFSQAQVQKIEGQIVPFIVGQIQFNKQNMKQGLVIFKKQSSKNDEIMLNVLKGFSLLKAFKGKITGQGKDQKVAVLFAYEQMSNKEEIQNEGALYLEQADVQKFSNQIFVNFGDERQK